VKSHGPSHGKSAAAAPNREKPAREPSKGPQGKFTPYTPRQTAAPAAAPERPYSPNRLSAPRPTQSRPAQPRPPQPSTAPSGTIWLYGIHAIAAALANPNRRLRRLLLTKEAEAALQTAHPAPWPLASEPTDRARIDQLLGFDSVHQGAALLSDPLPPPTLAQIMERSGPILMLDQITDPRNVGAILRSAAAFKAAGVIVQERHAPDETGAMAKAASGALETVPLLRAVNLARTIVALRAGGFWVVGLAAGGNILRGSDFAERKVALVLGAEGEGLRRLTRETCDEIAGISMPGEMESLNVSAAATLALYEMARKA